MTFFLNQLFHSVNNIYCFFLPEKMDIWNKTCTLGDPCSCHGDLLLVDGNVEELEHGGASQHLLQLGQRHLVANLGLEIVDEVVDHIVLSHRHVL